MLLVEDDPTVRDSLKEVLLAEHYFVIPAVNGQQALDLADELSVDLVLLDVNMPVRNGWDAFERLTAEHPLLPIIIVTARPNQLFMALNAGAGALLEKPVDIPTLLQTMGNLLAETAEQRVARLAGKNSEFHYKPAAGNKEGGNVLREVFMNGLARARHRERPRETAKSCRQQTPLTVSLFQASRLRPGRGPF